MVPASVRLALTASLLHIGSLLSRDNLCTSQVAQKAIVTYKSVQRARFFPNSFYNFFHYPRHSIMSFMEINLEVLKYKLNLKFNCLYLIN